MIASSAGNGQKLTLIAAQASDADFMSLSYDTGVAQLTHCSLKIILQQ